MDYQRGAYPLLFSFLKSFLSIENLEKDVPLKTDTDPQYLPNLSRHIAGSHIKYNPLGTTLNKIVGEDSRLPRWHYTKNAHIAIADALTKRLKNV